MTARKLAAIAELHGCNPEPEEAFATDELAYALAESRDRADGLLGFAWALETRLPGTKAALRDGIISRNKAELIVYATQLLDPAGADAEDKVLRSVRARRLTPGGLRAAIARAVMEVAPAKPVSGGRWRRRTRGCNGGRRIRGMPR